MFPIVIKAQRTANPAVIRIFAPFHHHLFCSNPFAPIPAARPKSLSGRQTKGIPRPRVVRLQEENVEALLLPDDCYAAVDDSRRPDGPHERDIA
jgi:hypothetical protein